MYTIVSRDMQQLVRTGNAVEGPSPHLSMKINTSERRPWEAGASLLVNCLHRWIKREKPVCTDIVCWRHSLYSTFLPYWHSNHFYTASHSPIRPHTTAHWWQSCHAASMTHWRQVEASWGSVLPKDISTGRARHWTTNPTIGGRPHAYLLIHSCSVADLPEKKP